MAFAAGRAVARLCRSPLPQRRAPPERSRSCARPRPDVRVWPIAGPRCGATLGDDGTRRVGTAQTGALHAASEARPGAHGVRDVGGCLRRARPKCTKTTIHRRHRLPGRHPHRPIPHGTGVGRERRGASGSGALGGASPSAIPIRRGTGLSGSPGPLLASRIGSTTSGAQERKAPTGGSDPRPFGSVARTTSPLPRPEHWTQGGHPPCDRPHTPGAGGAPEQWPDAAQSARRPSCVQ